MTKQLRISASYLAFTLFSLIAVPSMTGCDATGPEDGLSGLQESSGSATADARYCDPDDFECLPSGGGGGGGTGTPAQYRITVGLQGGYGGTSPNRYFDAYAFTRHEQEIGGTWVKVNGSNNGVICYVDGYERDRDIESSAGFTDVSFIVSPGQVGYGYHYVVCNHFSTSPNGVTHTQQTSQQIFLGP